MCPNEILKKRIIELSFKVTFIDRTWLKYQPNRCCRVPVKKMLSSLYMGKCMVRRLAARNNDKIPSRLSELR